MGQFLLHWAGLDNASGAQYLFWSGVVGVSIPTVLWRKHVCHVPRCLRLGRHPTAGGTYVLCGLHHPGVAHKRKPQGHPLRRHQTLDLIVQHHHRSRRMALREH